MRAQHRAEDLLAHDLHVVAACRSSTVGCDEIALRRRRARRRSRPSRPRRGPTRCSRDALELLLRDQRAHLGRRDRGRAPTLILPALVARRPRPPGRRRCLCDEQARAGGAALAVVEEDARCAAPAIARSRSASGNTITGDLPPSSSDTLLQVAGGGLHDQLADLGRAGEGDLVDVRDARRAPRRRSRRSRSRC